MKEHLVLEEVHDDQGKYLGKIVVYKKDLEKVLASEVSPKHMAILKKHGWDKVEPIE